MKVVDWFLRSGSKVLILPDRIWMGKRAKYAGIAREAAEALGSNDPSSAVFLVAHFPVVRAALEEMAERAGLDRRVVRSILATDWKGQVDEGLEAGSTALIIVGERHPLRSHDEAIVEAAGNASKRCRLRFHLSLDDPLIARLSGERVGNLLKRLGMTEERPMESSLISRRFKAA
jgi:preprotein translocase subunit SecA